MPTSAQHTFSPGAKRVDPVLVPELAVEYNVPLKASTTFAQGTVLGKKTADGLYQAYADAAADGSQTALCILQYACSTDASSNITIEGEWGVTRKEAPVWVAGYFATEDLTGLDAAGVVDLGGSVIVGNTTTGILKF